MEKRLRSEEDQPKVGSVLIVDDDPMTLLIYSKFLEAAGAEVISVSSGLDALSLLSTRQFDLMLLDNVMPELTGIQLLELLPSQGLPSIPRIVMLSASESAQMVERCKVLGAEDVLHKPVPPAVLRALVQVIAKE